MKIVSVPTGESPRPARRHHVGLGLIAWFKLIKAALLLATAIGLLRLLHRDLSATLEHWAMIFRVDPDNRFIHGWLARVANVDPRELRAISAGSFFYSALLFTEGVGLWFEWGWAKYLTVVATSSFIPLELYELARGLNAVKLAVLTINLAVVAYLIQLLRHDKAAQPKGAANRDAAGGRCSIGPVPGRAVQKASPL